MKSAFIIRIQIADTPFPLDFKKKGKCNHWTYRYKWHEAKNATIKTILAPEPNHFGIVNILHLADYLTLIG